MTQQYMCQFPSLQVYSSNMVYLKNFVSGRDPKFTSDFWKQLMQFNGIQFKIPSIRHPQTDVESEIMNLMVYNYLRYYCSYHQDD